MNDSVASEDRVFWQPSAASQKASPMGRYLNYVNKRFSLELASYAELHHWSVSQTADFWTSVADFCQIKWLKSFSQTYIPPPAGKMRGAQWFKGSLLNFADNLLPASSDRTVISSLSEGAGMRYFSAKELRAKVTACADALRKVGVTKGDRVAGVMANTPEAIIAMLASVSLGAIWSSCSPDFGVSGILDRLSQVKPKVIFFTSAYQYSGKFIDCTQTMADVLKGLSGVERLVAVSHLESVPNAKANQASLTLWEDFLATATSQELTFEPVEFSHPLFIMFSSGTTGVPKCIVHSTGGTLLQLKKELMLHSGLTDGSSLLFFTTCGWMMWNWMVSALACGSRLVLYEGAPSFPDMGVLWRLLAQERVEVFGTSPKFIGACIKAGLDLTEVGDLAPLRAILSTGSPLLSEHFDWIYQELGQERQLASISGGTDIISCFMLGNPLKAVRRGEIQGPGLGMAIEAWDDQGRRLQGEKGELVCTKPFVSMPVGFWNDPDGKKYGDAYFNHYPNLKHEVWRHGDFVEFTSHGGIIVYGRSDATLNPGGVRIGTAELYRQIESMPEIADSLAAGQDHDGDVRVVLFVKMAPGKTFNDDLVRALKARIRKELTPRHVPSLVFPVKDIPYTRSGKKVEDAVRKIINGEVVLNLGAIANPDSLADYYQARQTLGGA